MTPEQISALLNTGSSGILIVLIIYVLAHLEKVNKAGAERERERAEMDAARSKASADAIEAKDRFFFEYIDKRDTEQRDFFTKLNASNTGDMLKLLEVMRKLVDAVDKVTNTVQEHEASTETRLARAIDEALRISESTRPKRPNKGG